MPGFRPGAGYGVLTDPPVTSDYNLVWGHPDAAGIKKMLCDGYDFAEERVDAALER